MERDFFSSNTVLREIFDHLSDAVYFVDHQGIILYMNKAAEKLDGYTLQQAEGHTVTELYGLDTVQSPLLRVTASKEPLYDHTLRYDVNNREVYKICNTFPIEFPDGTWGAFSIQKDVTKLKETIEKNIELQKKFFKYHDETPVKGEKEGKLFTFNDIIGNHPLLQECKNLAYNAAQSDAPIFLCGRTGTGKELFAQSIHSASKRKNETFLAINCAAIPETLLEGLLFGTEKGVFTGAIERKGLFEQADGGTLFLDEINSMPLSSQSKLLRVIEDKYVTPLGSKEKIKINTRIISSCNVFPREAIKKQQIREDLFYRLAVINILIPSLEERKSDVFLLANHFISQYNAKYGKKVQSMDDEVTNFIMDYPWPGNVRQLKYSIECAMNLVNDDEVTIKKQHLPFYLKEGLEYGHDSLTLSNLDLPAGKLNPPITAPEMPKDNASGEVNILSSIRQNEKEKIIAALIKNQGHITNSAQELGVSRQTLVYRMKKYGIK
ncbi:sigma-54 interaction domain-containing protein [Dehalobacterium formicoaceticum]|uniref:sigma-54 interaction domain-containing protein n=1 Tax=Dehalobacterium formicoaceticum TaxID=51515 RepID=UPI000B7D6448|nr:sigma 54-interacting transcriptional regulator [Dehalobacterium formicoaceticum]